ncbi:MAG: tRNA (adenosine(37)-N6)-dimethylallyltransferase MiaA [Thermodesulfovibrionia bacterium]
MNDVIIIAGPTCVGKTGASILLARKLNTEIISADSMQVYRHMDIGTAKPSHEQLREVRHHLIDILSPHESFSAGEFKRRAIEIIDALHKRGKIPIIVGGTGLYIRTLTRGLFDAPSADWSLRERLMELEKEKGKGVEVTVPGGEVTVGYLYGYLQRLDPLASERINPNDLRRVIRAIEVTLKANRRITDLQLMNTKPLPYNFIKICLIRDRRELYKRIEERVDWMIHNGLIDETKRLLSMRPTMIAMQALGYKEMASYINGEKTLDEAVDLLKKRTKRYAKRQITWFKKEADMVWVDITGLIEPDDILTRMIRDVEILNGFIYSKNW